MNNLVEDLKYLSEMIIHGKRGGIQTVVAYRKDAWLFDDFSDEVDEIDIPGIDTDEMDLKEFLELVRDNGRSDIFIGEIDGDRLRQMDDSQFKFDPKS